MIGTNDYWILDNKFIFKSVFNVKIDKYNDLIRKSNTLIFSNYNDAIICIETNNQYLSKYDQIFYDSIFNKIIELPKNLTLITFGRDFNQKIELPENLTQITFGVYFNQEVDIPFRVKYLKLGCNNLSIIENLPNCIEELELGLYFNLELNNLPNSIKIIKFGKKSEYDKELNNLLA